MIIYRPWKNNPDNPMGLPGEYPDEAIPNYKEGDRVPEGFVVSTEEEYKKAIADNVEAAKAAIANYRQSVKSSEENKLTAFKQLFQDGRAIESNWASATNAQKLELARITFRILWLARTSLAESVRPEAS